MKHLTKKRNGKSMKSLSRPHGNKKNKQRVDKKRERQDAMEDISVEFDRIFQRDWRKILA